MQLLSLRFMMCHLIKLVFLIVVTYILINLGYEELY